MKKGSKQETNKKRTAKWGARRGKAAGTARESTGPPVQPIIGGKCSQTREAISCRARLAAEMPCRPLGLSADAPAMSNSEGKKGPKPLEHKKKPKVTRRADSASLTEEKRKRGCLGDWGNSPPSGLSLKGGISFKKEAIRAGSGPVSGRRKSGTATMGGDVSTKQSMGTGNSRNGGRGAQIFLKEWKKKRSEPAIEEEGGQASIKGTSLSLKITWMETSCRQASSHPGADAKGTSPGCVGIGKVRRRANPSMVVAGRHRTQRTKPANTQMGKRVA